MKILKFILGYLFFISIIINPATAQIVYTDVNPDSTLSCNTSAHCQNIYNLDLNNDGIIDFIIESNHFISSCTPTDPGSDGHGVRVSSLNGNSFATIHNDTYDEIDAIDSAMAICSTSNVWVNYPGGYFLKHHVRGTFGYPNCLGTISIDTYGNWPYNTFKCVGLKLVVGVDTLYGWVRISQSVSAAYSGFTIKDYAYNSTPDQIIIAGQTTLGTIVTYPLDTLAVCQGGNPDITFSINGSFNVANVFTAEISDTSGSFLNPVSLGIFSGNTSGTINSVIPPGLSNGMYRVRITSNNPSSASNNIALKLLFNPALNSFHITTNDSVHICPNQYISLLAPLIGTSYYDFYYQWTLNDNAIANEDFWSYDLADTAGVYRCEITNICGTGLSDSIVTTYGPLPPSITASGPLWICPGQAVTLSTNYSTNLSYTWFRNGLSAGTQSADTIYQSGNYYVQITDSQGCSNSSVHYSVAVSNPFASIVAGGPITFCFGDSVILSQTAISDTSFTFQWYRDNIIIPGGTEQSYRARLTGAYTVIVSNPNGNCSSTSNVININVGCNGIGESTSTINHFSIILNSGIHAIEINKQTSESASVQIMNSIGQIIYSDNFNLLQKLIDVSSFPKGIFIINISAGNYYESKEIIINN